MLNLSASALIASAGILGWPPSFSHRQSENPGNGFIAVHLQRPCLITAVLFKVQSRCKTSLSSFDTVSLPLLCASVTYGSLMMASMQM